MYKFGDCSAILCYDLNGSLQPLWTLGLSGSQSVFPMLSWTFPGTSLSGEFTLTKSPSMSVGARAVEWRRGGPLDFAGECEKYAMVPIHRATARDRPLL